jgi:hypothetical protein
MVDNCNNGALSDANNENSHTNNSCYSTVAQFLLPFLAYLASNSEEHFSVTSATEEFHPH